jgi:hypothetical protein
MVRVTADPTAATPPIAQAQPMTVSEAVRAGSHLRLSLRQGPVHVWLPSGYRPDGAATVVYVHGYYDSVDDAWRSHRLPEQFALAGLNAMFIAPEAPVGIGLAVNFPDLLELIQTVEASTGTWRGSGPVVAVGHSGAFRTLEKWLDEPLLETVILVDALYGAQDKFAEWIDASTQHRLITVGDDTLRWGEDLARDIAGTVVADQFPVAAEDWTREERAARHLYIRSQFGHMAQVTEGVALPLLLRLLPVPRLPDTAWHQPLGQLPTPWGMPPSIRSDEGM